ncbi:MAG: ferric reductase-like transmembrane domain-containing protein [Opitutaceae bacterium]|nr:ferric reductase-like transmembrane domain-containing protein [Opitutaceae bacterium]
MSFLGKFLRAKAVIWILIILPGLWPAWPLFYRQDPSVLADPLKFVLLHLGFTASLLLAIVLTFTPLRVLFPKWDVALALNRHRRLVGVSAFAYGAIHFSTHLFYELQGGAQGVGHVLKTDVTKPFLVTGMIALTLLLVLAITSLQALIRWLGGKAWKNLHRLAYVAAALIAYHQSAARKVFPMQVLWIFIPLVLLELARFVKQRRGRTAPRMAPVRPGDQGIPVRTANERE